MFALLNPTIHLIPMTPFRKVPAAAKKSMNKKSPKRTLKLKPVQIVRGRKQIMFRKGSLSKLKLNLLKSLAKEKSPFQKKL